MSSNRVPSTVSAPEADAHHRMVAIAPATPKAPPHPGTGILAEIAAGLVAEATCAAAGALSRPDRAPGRGPGRRCAVAVRTDDQLQLVNESGCRRPCATAHGGRALRPLRRGRRRAGTGLGRPTLAPAPHARATSGRASPPLLAVPLQHRGRLLGVYNLFFASGDEPAPTCWPSCKSVGELLGLALNNARLEAREPARHADPANARCMAAEVHDSLAQSLAFVEDAHAAAATTRCGPRRRACAAILRRRAQRRQRRRTPACAAS